MSNLARQKCISNRFYTLDELIEKIESVTAEELQGWPTKFFQTDRSLLPSSAISTAQLTREHLAC